MDNDDHTRYVKLIDPLAIIAQAGSLNVAEGTPTNATHATVTVLTSVGTQAQASLLFIDQPADGETVTLDTIVFEFDNDATVADGNTAVTIGADLAETVTNLVSLVNGFGFGINQSSSNQVTFIAPTPGLAGNSLVATETIASASFDGASGYFTGAVVPTDGDTLTIGSVTYTLGTDILVDGLSLDDFMTNIANALATNPDVDILSTTAGYTILQSKGRGAAVNSLPLTSTTATITFSPLTFTGGTDGTPAPAGTLLYDSNYLYICPLGNTISQANWRRLGMSSF